MMYVGVIGLFFSFISFLLFMLLNIGSVNEDRRTEKLMDCPVIR